MKWPTIFGTIIQFHTHTHTPFPDFALTEISMVCGKTSDADGLKTINSSKIWS